MTLNINITVPEDVVKADQASGYIGRALNAIGFSRGAVNEAAPVGQPAPALAPEPEKPAPKTRAKKADKPAPETQPDTPEAEAQDAADEAAEVEEARDAKAPLTLDDVRAAMTDYVAKFTMEATQEDGPKIFTEALGSPPPGETYWKLSLVPDDQATLAKVVETWKKATELNPLKRKAV